jgi:4-carboxymuconolactone decarboxylase
MATVSIKENAVLGDEELQRKLREINPEFGDICIRFSGEIFGKPLIDQKTKALIAIAIDVVEQLRGIPFENHVDIAMKQGATREELEELLLLMTVYAGFNKAGGFYGELNRVLEAREKKLKEKGAKENT